MKYQITINSINKNFEIEISEQDELDFISNKIIYSNKCSPLFLIANDIFLFDLHDDNKKILLIKWLIKNNCLWRLNSKYSDIFLKFYEEKKIT
jgi:hypothetical protein